MSQKQAWEQEYSKTQGVPTSTRIKPSSAVVKLLDYIDRHDLDTDKRALDIGCGAGRNSLYLAENGYDVTAIDFAQPALDKLNRVIVKKPLSGKIHTKQCDLIKPLPFDDNSFDVAIDIVSTISLHPDEMRTLAQELRRVIAPNGLLLSYVHSRDDGYLRAVAPEAISYTIEGLTDYTWTKEELEALYANWKILEMIKTEKVDDFYGKDYTRRIWWLLLKNTKA